MPRTKATHVQVYILIRGVNAGQIFDMLRYDNAAPATGDDAAKLEACATSFGERGKARWICLSRFVTYGSRKDPEVARWRSFGWECDARAFDDYGTALGVQRTRNAEIERQIS